MVHTVEGCKKNYAICEKNDSEMHCWVNITDKELENCNKEVIKKLALSISDRKLTRLMRRYEPDISASVDDTKIKKVKLIRVGKIYGERKQLSIPTTTRISTTKH